MQTRKHAEKNSETKVIQTRQDAKQSAEKEPAEALSRIDANVANPGDISALQRTLGNRVVQQLITKKSQPGIVVVMVIPYNSQ